MISTSPLRGGPVVGAHPRGWPDVGHLPRLLTQRVVEEPLLGMLRARGIGEVAAPAEDGCTGAFDPLPVAGVAETLQGGPRRAEGVVPVGDGANRLFEICVAGVVGDRLPQEFAVLVRVGEQLGGDALVGDAERTDVAVRPWLADDPVDHLAVVGDLLRVQRVGGAARRCTPEPRVSIATTAHPGPSRALGRRVGVLPNWAARGGCSFMGWTMSTFLSFVAPPGLSRPGSA